MFSKEILWMGVLNVTPDSFSDAGKFHSKDAAFQQATRLIEAGADILDIGGESTRPFSDPVSVDEELNRVIPVIEKVRSRFDIPISVDTQKREVLAECLKYKIQILNDVSGGINEQFAQLVKTHSLYWIIMHTQGPPKTMQVAPNYPQGVVTEVKEFLTQKIKRWQEFGIDKKKLWIDPGIGFGKTVADNVELLQNLRVLTPIADRLVLGTSRKSFIPKLSPPDCSPTDRIGGTIATTLFGWQQGASVFRVHEVFPNIQAFNVWKKLYETRLC